MNTTYPQSETRKFRAASISLAVTLFLIVAKLTAGWLSGSLAIISLAAESAFDFLAVLLTFVAIRISALPPDEDHPYGHGKFDSVAALLQNLFLVGVSVGICYEAIHRLANPSSTDVNIDTLTLVILLVSFLLDMWRSRVLHKVAHESKSHTLKADSLHFLADAMSILIVGAGVLLAKFANIPAADSFAAIAVSFFVGFQSIRQAKDAVDVLMDRIPNIKEYSEVKNAIQEVHGIISLDSLKMRRASSVVFVDVAVSIKRVLPYAAIEAILKEIETNIRSVATDAEINIQWKPIRTETESPFETIKLITSEFGILPHNIELSKDENGNVTLDLHIEFPQGTTFDESHATSEEIEAQILRQLPQIGRVVTHLEEERSDLTVTDVLDITSLDPEFASRVNECARSAGPHVKNVRSIILWKTVATGEEKLAVTIELPSGLSLIAAHDIVTDVEKTLRKCFPKLARIVIHSEPA